jgi:hypothetical protein
VEERMGNACSMPSSHQASPPPNLLVESRTMDAHVMMP